MIEPRQRTLLTLVALAGLSAQSVSQEPADVQATIRGILARSEAVFSGRMSYRKTTGFQDAQSSYTENYELIFMLPSWRLSMERYEANKPVFDSKGEKATGATVTGTHRRVIQSHKGKLVDFKQIPQIDGSVNNLVRIAGEQPIVDNAQAPPAFAGTSWANCTMKFVKQHMAAVRRRAEQTIDGHRVEVLEWDVAEPEAFSAFYWCCDGTLRGGTLRLYAAPDLGYALPRVEYVARDGTVSTSFEASGFSKYGGGIFLPKQCSRKALEVRNKGHFITYDLDRVSAINEPIPDSDFVVNIPDGTSGGDARSGKGSTPFTVKSDGILPDGIADVVQRRNPFWGFNRATAIVAGCGVGIVGLGLFAAARRVLRRRAT